MATWNNDTEWAPVAEYRGVALLERPGNVWKDWQGDQYATDGHIWLWFREGGKGIGIPSERLAKAHLDELTNPSAVYFSMKECFAMLGVADATVHAYRWDEAKEAFVVDDGIKDGQHRMK